MSDTYQAVYDAVRSRMSNGDIGQAVTDAINQQAGGLGFAIESVKTEYAQAADAHRVAGEQAQRPSVLYRPGLSIDGNQWCALYGENLQDGVTGFGDSPAAAMLDFDANWNQSLAARERS